MAGPVRASRYRVSLVAQLIARFSNQKSAMLTAIKRNDVFHTDNAVAIALERLESKKISGSAVKNRL